MTTSGYSGEKIKRYTGRNKRNTLKGFTVSRDNGNVQNLCATMTQMDWQEALFQTQL